MTIIRHYPPCKICFVNVFNFMDLISLIYNKVNFLCFTQRKGSFVF